jgi:hypothetical protein
MASHASAVTTMSPEAGPGQLPAGPRLVSAEPPAATQCDRLWPPEVAQCCLCGIALPLGLLVADGGQACTDRWTAADRPERAHIPVPGYAFAVAGTRLRMPGRRLRMERRQNSRAAWSKRQSPPCNRVPQLQRGPGVIEVIKGTATARSGQLTMPCPVCAQRRYDDVIGSFLGLINTINARLPLGDIFLISYRHPRNGASDRPWLVMSGYAPQSRPPTV